MRLKGNAKKAVATVTIAAKGLRSTLHTFKERNTRRRLHPNEVKRRNWAYGAGPGTLAGLDDL